MWGTLCHHGSVIDLSSPGATFQIPSIPGPGTRCCVMGCRRWELNCSKTIATPRSSSSPGPHLASWGGCGHRARDPPPIHMATSCPPSKGITPFPLGVRHLYAPERHPSEAPKIRGTLFPGLGAGTESWMDSGPNLEKSIFGEPSWSPALWAARPAQGCSLVEAGLGGCQEGTIITPSSPER